MLYLSAYFFSSYHCELLFTFFSNFLVIVPLNRALVRWVDIDRWGYREAGMYYNSTEMTQWNDSKLESPWKLRGAPEPKEK